jgi:hypothetical protein
LQGLVHLGRPGLETNIAALPGRVRDRCLGQLPLGGFLCDRGPLLGQISQMADHGRIVLLARSVRCPGQGIASLFQFIWGKLDDLRIGLCRMVITARLIQK